MGPSGQSAVRHSLPYLIGKCSPKLSHLPASIMHSLAAVLKGYPRALLRPDVARLLELNREACRIRADYILPQLRGPEAKMDIQPDELPRSILEYGERECMAYLAWQMPFTYGCLERIFTEIKTRVPHFAPKNIFDFGTGPATAILCANELWGQSIKSIHGADISEPMLELAQKMLAGRPAETISLKRFLPLSGVEKRYDLTVAAFALADLPDDGVRKHTVNALWAQTKDILVLVDRGTPEGSRVIANARQQILTQAGYLNAEGGTIQDGFRSDASSSLHIVAPCPHEKKCPMLGSWCHFAQRIQVTPFQQETHNIGKGFVDQKFSYLVLKRGPRPPQESPNSSPPHDEEGDATAFITASHHWPRLIRRPLKRQGHVVNDYCDPDGSFKRIVVPKSQGRQIYYDARKCRWGDLWPHASKHKPVPIETLSVKTKKRGKKNPRPRSGDGRHDEMDADYY